MKNVNHHADSHAEAVSEQPDMLYPSEGSPRPGRVPVPNLAPKHLTRKEVAERLGVTVHEVRRRENAGTLRPSGRDPRGWVLYSEEDIAGIPKHAPRKTHGTLFTVGEASAVYKLLKEGMPLVDIVCEAGIHPDAVQAIAASYARLTGAMLVPAEVMSQVNALPLDAVFPLESPEALYECMKEAADGAKCRGCKAKPRTHCVGCGAQAAKRRASEV